MDDLLRACRSGGQFPRPGTILEEYAFEHHLENHFAKLNKKNTQLFAQNEADSSLNFLQLEEQRPRAWRSEKITTLAGLRTFLNIASNSPTVQRDPKCRFLFVWAPNSRDRLYSTREQLLTVFTYLQVLPGFLDFLYPFGRQQYPQDSYFSDFQAVSRLSVEEQGVPIPTLGRSGRDLRMCYSLKSVERTTGPLSWPWSIRQASIYHSFDVVNGDSNWVIIKGDDLLKRRMTQLAASKAYATLSASSTPEKLFSATLNAHLVACDWAGEQWRWCLNFLDEEFQQMTRQSYAVQIIAQDTPEYSLRPARRSTLRAEVHDTSRAPSPARMLQGLRQHPPPPSNPPTAPPPGHPAAAGRIVPTGDPEKPPLDTPQVEDLFSFEDLQRLQFLEEKAIEALLVLDSNAKVMDQMRQYYESVRDCDEWPDLLKQHCQRDLSRFLSELTNMQNRMLLEKDRTETLLRILSNRKSMLYGILEYRNIEASKAATQQAQISADKSQQSANEMHKLTIEMNDVAFKTARQTALMTLIAFVTIIYLPGTFISTVMSTSIVQWSTDDGKSVLEYSWPALKTFLEASLPLTGVTVFLCSGAFILWIRSRKRSGRGASLQTSPC